MNILVCFALKEEARHFTPPAHCTVRLSNVGPRPAEKCIRAALAEAPPGLVLTCGYAGGLNPDLAFGTLVCDADAGFPLQPQLTSLGAVPARFHCADRIAPTAAEKQSLRERTGADVVEMESGIIRAICREHGVPSATVRIISDTASEDLPLDFNEFMTPEGTMNLGKLMGRLAFNPGKVPELLQFQKRMDEAARLLGDFLGRLFRL